MRIGHSMAALVTLTLFLPGGAPAPARAADPVTARLVLDRSLPPLRGDRLQVKVVEVSYPPGGSSTPHTHPCAVLGYVAEGAYRSQVKGEQDSVYRTGQTFYEPPNGVHLISANASQDRPVRFTATFICDTNVALSAPAAEH